MNSCIGVDVSRTEVQFSSCAVNKHLNVEITVTLHRGQSGLRHQIADDAQQSADCFSLWRIPLIPVVSRYAVVVGSSVWVYAWSMLPEVRWGRSQCES